MKTYHAMQRLTAAFLFLSICLQSCIPSLQLGYAPQTKGNTEKQEKLANLGGQVSLLPSQNSLAWQVLKESENKKSRQDLVTNSGESIVFYEHEDSWMAKVNPSAGYLQRSEDLPVVCAPSMKIETVKQMAKSQAKQVIHRVTHPKKAFIYLGKMGLAGGMMEDKKEANPKLYEAIKQLKNNAITNLSLRDDQIGPEGARDLAEALKTNTSLTNLDLYNNQIGAQGAKDLAEALKTNTSLTTLDLYDNQIGAQGAKDLAEALKTNTSLTTLDLSDNQIGAQGARDLAEALKINTAITNLDLSANELGDQGAGDLAEILKTNTAITKLDLSFNQIGAQGARDLAEALKTNTAITKLDLTDNQIRAQGARDLAEALKTTNTAITMLYLSANELGPQGAKDLAEALKTNTAITNLDLNYNQIGDQEAIELAKALKTNTALTNLSLSHNQIGDEGARALAEALKTNTALTNLSLSYNPIGAQLRTEIETYITNKFNNKLTEVAFLNEQLDKIVANASRAALEEGLRLLKQIVNLANAIAAANPDQGNELLKHALYKKAQLFARLHEYDKALQSINQLNQLLGYGYTALHWAALRGDLAIASLFLQAGAKFNAVDRYGVRPIHLAIAKGDLAIVKLLLDKGDKLPKIVPQKGCTPLHLAAYNGYLDLANFLLEKGADPTITDDHQRTPLHIAAYRGHMPIISRLLLCNIDFNAQDDYTDTFLHKLVDNAQLTPEERLHRFTEVMKGIENNHHSFLKRVEKLMLDCCPVLTNNIATENILTMVVDYIQGVDLTLKNQAGRSTLDMIQGVLTEAPNNQGYSELVKILARHQELGRCIRF